MEQNVDEINPIILPNGMVQMTVSFKSFNELKDTYEKYLQHKQASRKYMQNKKTTDDSPPKEHQTRRQKYSLKFNQEKILTQ
jgi:hypothetical protein